MKAIKGWILCLATILLSSLHGNLLFDKQGEVSLELKALLELFPLKYDGSISSLVEATQSSWLQKGRKRWEFASIPTEDNDKFIHCVQLLDCYEDIYPTKTQYDYAVLLGSTVPRMQSRISFLKKLCERGTSFPILVFLTSKRPIDPKGDGDVEYSTEEAAGMSLIHELFPDIKVVCVSVPLENKDLNSVFPNTADTLSAWISTSPIPGSCLFISNQPFVHYQDAIVHSILPNPFLHETVGPRSTFEIPASLFLDTIAKWLYCAYSNWMNLSGRSIYVEYKLVGQ